VDNTPATPEYKLLQFRQCLAGEALKATESMGHLVTAYHRANVRLKMKLRGQRCQIALYSEEVDNFRSIYDGLLYLKLQKKLPTTMLSAYHWWGFENHNQESVERGSSKK